MRILYLFVTVYIMSISQGCFAQIFDDFSDDENFRSGVWCGETDKFCVDRGQLQLCAAEAGTAATAVSCGPVTGECEWRWLVKLPFAPSNNNCVRIYLAADDCNLLSPTLKGFYVQLGENGSADAIELFEQNGSSVRSLCRGTPGLIAASFQLRLRVVASSNHWQLFVEDADAGDWLLEAEGDAAFNAEKVFYTGLLCRCTSSNTSKFFFDDFYAGPLLRDTLPPELVSVTIDNQLNRLLVEFSENLDSSALLPHHYLCDGRSLIMVEFASRRNQLYLTFTEPFAARKEYVLQVNGVADKEGNELVYAEMPFLRYVSLRNDIVISEIMSDPSPSVGLPECEYVELQSRLPFAVNLRGWTLKIGNSSKVLPDYQLDAYERVVVLAQNNMDNYPAIDHKIAVPTMSITNAGQQLTLLDDSACVVHSVNFSASWHHNSLKADGGWSLEMMDVDNPCGEADNWDSSNDANGGTPALPNSIAENNADMEPPQLLNVTVLDSVTLKLFLSETVLPSSASLFAIDHGIAVDFVWPLAPENKCLLLHLDKALRSSTIYTLQLVDTLCDCVGNVAPLGASFTFGVPQRPVAGDIVINELLANSYGSTIADFVELYNRSNKIIDLSSLLIGTDDAGEMKVYPVYPNGYQLFPKEYVALCRNRTLTSEQYNCPYPRKLVQCDILPDYPQSEGTVLLTDNAYNQIDRFCYNEDMHYQMLKSMDGVSLERIHPDAETQDANNWKSASALAGFATPGYRNSQYSDANLNEELFSIEPQIFSPDGDGFDDFTECCCRFNQNNCRVTMKIYNRIGQLVRTLANNVIVGTNNCFVWDGVTDDGISAPPGLYVIRMSYWNLDGKRKSQAKVVGITYRDRVK